MLESTRRVKIAFYNTTVTHPSTNHIHDCLTSVYKNGHFTNHAMPYISFLKYKGHKLEDSKLKKEYCTETVKSKTKNSLLKDDIHAI